jgi:hypothetical protein
MTAESVPGASFDTSDFGEVDDVSGGPVGRQADTFIRPVGTWSCSEGHGWRLLSRHFDEYFTEGSVLCPVCAGECDLPRRLAVPYAERLVDYHYPLGLAGANATTFRVDLERGRGQREAERLRRACRRAAA